MDKINWGILGTANIGREKVIPAMQSGKHTRIEAIASRNLETAQKTAESTNIPRYYGSYEELLADSGIHAIYNPLPNHLHVSWTIKALEAGKHVLCEKPIALDEKDMRTLMTAADKHPHLKVMEAFMYRFHPQWEKVLDMVKNGKIGDLLTIQSFFSYFNRDPGNYRNQPGTGGGALMDIGCYCIHLSRLLFGKEPVRVFGCIDNDPEFKIDRHTSGILDFGTGTSSFTCSTQMSPHQRVIVIGSEGRIEIITPFNQPPDKPGKLKVFRGKKLKHITVKQADQYTVQGDLFSRAILENTPLPVSLDDAAANMRVIDAVFRSGEKGQWEMV